MKKLLVIVALLLRCGVCSAQPGNHPHNPYRYALIDGESTTIGRNKIQFTNNESGYGQYVQEIIGAYKAMFRLSEIKSSILRSGLVNFYTPGGVHIDDLHLYIAERMKALLPEAQYEEWKGLESYPEYQSYYPKRTE